MNLTHSDFELNQYIYYSDGIGKIVSSATDNEDEEEAKIWG